MQPAIMLIVLAQSHPALDMGRNFRQASENFRWSNVILVVAVAAMMALGTWLLMRIVQARESRNYYHPGRLFKELCAAHQLDRASRALLGRLAKAHALPQPALLFVEPERFDAAQLDTAWQCDRAKLERLRDTIFGVRLESPNS